MSQDDSYVEYWWGRSDSANLRLALALNDNGDAFADGSVSPSDLVCGFGNGIDPATWHPLGGGGVGDAWTLSTPLAPLAPYKDYYRYYRALNCGRLVHI